MHPTLLEFITQEHICVLTTLVGDGGPYSSTMYYTYNPADGNFYFVADLNDMKCEILSESDPTFASVVIGFDADKWKSAHFRGELYMVPESEDEFLIKSLFKDKDYLRNFITSDTRVILRFVPNWWKFTDAANGSKITSEKAEKP